MKQETRESNQPEDNHPRHRSDCRDEQELSIHAMEAVTVVVLLLLL
jgi:hypothetical protein